MNYLAGRIVALLAVALAPVHLARIDAYGWFRDELYYLACGAHPALGYVDHPPLIGWVAAAVRLAGGSFLAVRAPAILAGAVVVFLTAGMASRFGADTAGKALAALAILMAPTYLFVFHTLSMNAFEVPIWSATALVLMAIHDAPKRKHWVVLGLLVGVGFLNKHSMLFFATALLLAQLATPKRTSLRGGGLWIAVALATAVALPHVLWQVQNDFPSWTFYRNAQARKVVPLTAPEFLSAQVLLAGPGNALLWIPGLVWLLLGRRGREHRAFGLAFVALLAFFIVARGKAYYLTPFYPILYAAGGAALSGWLGGRARNARALGYAIVGMSIVTLGLVAAPLAYPALPVDETIAWGRLTGLSAPKAERAPVADLPQHLADMFGWHELVHTIDEVMGALPPGQRSRAQIVVSNYGQAGAIDWLGRASGLPRAQCPHNSYFDWGTPAATDPVIVVGDPSAGASMKPSGFEPREGLGAIFEEVTEVARTACAHCMPGERDLPVYLCRRWKRDPRDVWAQIKRYF